MSRLEDIKDLSFGISPVSDYVINRGKGSSGEDFSVTIPNIETGYPPGANITIKGMSGLVTTREFVVGPDGYRTVLTGVSRVADVIRKAPAKTLTFMSLTPNELEEFQIANTAGSGLVSYSKLDYTPLIKVCNEKDLTGGWSSDQVIQYLVGKIGLKLICNVRSYWVRQVQADTQSSYFDTIVSIVNFLRPTIYIDDGALYILNKPFRSGNVSFDKVMQVSQRESFNYSSKVTSVKVQGGLGVWNRAKYKGNVSAERQVTLVNKVGAETGTQMWCKLRGDTATVSKMLGISMSGPEWSHKIASTQPMTDTTTTTETFRVDPFGNNKALLSRYTVTMNSLLSVQGLPDVKTFESTEGYAYEFLDEQYDRPRMVKKESSVGRYTWLLTQVGGYGSSRHFKQKVDNIVELWIYAPNGNLLAEMMTRKSDCFKLGDYIVELDLGDYFWTEEGEEPYDGYYVQAIVEEKIVRYRQVTSDIFQRMTYHRQLGGVRRKPGDGRHTSTTELVKGRVPKHPKSYRRMSVYAEQVPSGGSMVAPALVVGNPNIVSWSDANNILNDLKGNSVDYKYTVERQVVIPKDIPVDIGWPVEFTALPAGTNKTVPAVSVKDGMIAAWSKRKDAKSGVVHTILTLEGKVP